MSESVIFDKKQFHGNSEHSIQEQGYFENRGEGLSQPSSQTSGFYTYLTDCP